MTKWQSVSESFRVEEIARRASHYDGLLEALEIISAECKNNGKHMGEAGEVISGIARDAIAKVRGAGIRVTDSPAVHMQWQGRSKRITD